MKQLIVIGGPTASGKTELAIGVARRLGTEIISADSRQFYTEMRIGSARPTPEELAAVPHHFIADRSLEEPLSAGRYAEEATTKLDELFRAKDQVVAVGGSGLYLRALCEGLDEFPRVSASARTAVDELEREGGLTALQTALAELDPDYYGRVDRQNGRRLQRALRVCLTEGKPYSSYLGKKPGRRFTSRYFALKPGRESLYARIEARVDRMLAQGLEEEARELTHYQATPVLQTVGYQEWWPYFSGAYDRERAVELIKRNSRRYAKRQLTWFRNYQTAESVETVVTSL